MKTIDVDSTQSQEPLAVVRQEPQAVGVALTIDQLTERLDFIKKVMAEVMTVGTDYGKIPGCGDKPALFQPGAQKLALTFQLNPEVRQEIITDYDNHHRGYRIVVRVTNGNAFADGVGEASTLESKYRWVKSGRKCPDCGKETIIKGKKEYGGGWVCFTKKGGCGHKWPDGAQKIESQLETRVEADNAPDHWNTARKMAFKRAFVHAIINRTNTSELWSQDLEDLNANGVMGTPRDEYVEEPQNPPIQPQGEKRVSTPPPANQNAPETKPEPSRATQKHLDRLVSALEHIKDQAIGYFQSLGQLKENQTISNLSLEHCPTTKAQYDDLLGKIKAFAEGPHPDPDPEGTARDVTKEGEPWRTYQMPIGKHKGKTFETLIKDKELSKYMFGLWAKMSLEPSWTNDQGEVVNYTEAQMEVRRELRTMLDAMGNSVGFKKG